MLALLILIQVTAKSERDSIANSESEITYKVLPFAFYHNSLKWVAGGFAGVKGIAQEQTLLKVGGIVSTSESYYAYLQMEDFQLPFYPRIFFRPDLYVGKLGEIKSYMISKDPDAAPPGSNESTQDSYVVMEGSDQWYELTFRYLLPIAHGEEEFIHPKFEKGILKSGEAGGTNLCNPIESGRTFIDVKAFYRNDNLETTDGIKIHPVTFGLEYGLTWENMDYFFNPKQGNYLKIALLNDWGALGSNSEFNAWKIDYRHYIPLFDTDSDDAQRVLAFNIFTMDTPSWNEVKNTVTLPDGNIMKEYKRPQYFAGVNLGGVKKLRSFKDFRYFDKAMIFYSLELRQNLKWNPMDYFEFTRNIGIDFFQLCAFADAGRVAPEWDLKTLHQDMQWSAGAGLRFFMDGIVVRVDLAHGPEGTLSQMFIDHPF